MQNMQTTCKICKTCFKICKICSNRHFGLARFKRNSYFRGINNDYQQLLTCTNTEDYKT